TFLAETFKDGMPTFRYHFWQIISYYFSIVAFLYDDLLKGLLLWDICRKRHMWQG
ncbi:hypothetical protein ACJX0J_027996, partial [Zea mays]